MLLVMSVDNIKRIQALVSATCMGNSVVGCHVISMKMLIRERDTGSKVGCVIYQDAAMVYVLQGGRLWNTVISKSSYR